MDERPGDAAGEGTAHAHVSLEREGVAMSARKVIVGALLVAAVLQACAGNKPPLRAYQVTRQDQLIGGPSAKGKLGDFIVENDQIRALVGNVGPGWAAGVFGGTLLDVDRHRWWAPDRGGKGWDSFSEAFPLANLLVVDPLNPNRVVRLPTTDDPDSPVRVETTIAFVGIPEGKDGSDGEAVIRVQGHSAYMFDMLKFLNRDLLQGFLGDLVLAGFTFDQIVDMVDQFLGVNVFGLLNRLQISFDFTTDYILHEGESFLTMRTTVSLSPQSESLLGGCQPVPCDLECEHGYVFEEVSEPREGYASPFKRLCPVCECAPAAKPMPTFNESRDFFRVLLGGLQDWRDPAWRGGVVAGDFLFYGTEASVFVPGEGYDLDRKIFEDMWQGVGSLGSPYVYDFMAATARNVSYAWTTVNPNQKAPIECPTFRLTLTRLRDPSREDDVVQVLRDDYGMADADARVRQLVVDHRPIHLLEVDNGAADPGAAAGEAARQQAVDDWKARFLAEDARAKQAAARLGEGAVLDLVPAHQCLPSQVMVPLFSTSATAVLTHFSEGDRLEEGAGGAMRDTNRNYTYERYLAVGDGDVGSVLRTVYALRGVATGEVEGVVLEEGSCAPLSGVDVFAVKDPSAVEDCGEALGTWEAIRRCAGRVFGNSGVASQMQTDVGQDLTLDGGFSGPLPPGRYFLLAHAHDRGTSAPVPVTVTAGGTERVTLVLSPRGEIEYRVVDQGGQAIPARIAFIPLDATGMRYDWDGKNDGVLGDTRYDHGILESEHSATGTGTVYLPPGRYDVVASRGIEYGRAVVSGYEVLPGQRRTLQVVLPHEVDTSGHVTGDFHVHARNSVDSALPMDLRVAAAVAEGLEFVSSSDHDHVTDYWPYVLEMGLERYLATQVGVETSPLEWGHFNGYPLRYDDTKLAVHDPVQWVKRTMTEIWEGLKARVLGSPDDFVLQVNHPRDGFMGYFAQIGMRPYDLERKTPGMEMCNQALEEAPCAFHAMEVLNGKHAEYLRTPTVGEMEAHNRCFREVVAARDPRDFPLDEADPSRSVCGWLQADPSPACEGMVRPAGVTLPDGVVDQRVLWDHCQWHREFRDEMARCGEEGVGLLECKRIALEALKFLSVRFMLERTPEEEAAFWATTEATDVGCDYAKAMAGCAAIPREGGGFQVGCGGEDCPCEACVCGPHPECCAAPAQGGTGWTAACAAACREECHGCEVRPCTSRFQPIEDWFALLNAGLAVTGMSNSDSHNTLDEIGLPRNFIHVGTDRLEGLDLHDVNHAIRQHRVVMSSGPMVSFEIVTDDGRRGTVGDTLDATGARALTARIRVQTASWFRVDRVEVTRNGRLFRRLFPEAPKEAIVDLDATLDLGVQDRDAWFVVTAYGLEDREQLSPVYKRHPYGHILTQQVIALGADSLLASYKPDLQLLYDDPLLQPLLKSLLKVESVDDLVALASGALSSLSIQMPDSFPVIPWAMTNPVWVDVDGGGFTPPDARDEDGDGRWDLPPFCSRPCDPVAPRCGQNQVCAERPDGSAWTCQIPVPATCPK